METQTAQANPLDMPGMAFEMELCNPNPSARRTKDGPSYRISFECSEEAHREFMHARQSNLRLIAVMSVLPDTDEEQASESIREHVRARAQEKAKSDAEEAAKSPEEKLNGRAWSLLVYRRTFCNFPGVREMMADAREPHETKHTLDEQHKILKRVLGVGNLSEVGEVEALRFFDNSPPAQAAIQKAFKDAAVPRKAPDGPTVVPVSHSEVSAAQ